MTASEDDRWERAAKEILRLAMTRRRVTYAALALRMSECGSRVTAASIANRLSRGSFGAPFLLRALVALEFKGVELAGLYELVRIDALAEHD